MTNDYNQQSPNQNHQVNWRAINSEVISHYNALTDDLLSEVHIPTASIVCNDGDCSSHTHREVLNMFDSSIISCINMARAYVLSAKCKLHNNKSRPGWTEYVKELYDISRNAFIQWKESGTPISGQLFDRKEC